MGVRFSRACLSNPDGRPPRTRRASHALPAYGRSSPVCGGLKRIAQHANPGLLSSPVRLSAFPQNVIKRNQETKRPDLLGRPHCKGMAIGVARRGARRSGERTLRIPPSCSLPVSHACGPHVASSVRQSSVRGLVKSEQKVDMDQTVRSPAPELDLR